VTDASQPSGSRSLIAHVAVRALFKSVLINMVAPAILYRLSAPHFASTSLLPLAISGIPPVLWLAFSVIKLRAIDFLGLFAAESVVVSMVALVFAHTEREALIGRSLQNVVLAGIFLASLAFAKPLMFHMSRQLSTGNDPAKHEIFDLAASQPNVMGAYRVLTWGWIAALLIKAVGSYFLAVHLPTNNFLVASPLWDLVSDTMLVTWTIVCARARLVSSSDVAQLAKSAVVGP